jgi:hypothetical protein
MTFHPDAEGRRLLAPKLWLFFAMCAQAALSEGPVRRLT